MKFTLAAALVGALIASVQAHTWIEQLMVIAPNGTMVGAPGFPRGNVRRGSAGDLDPQMVNLIPPNGRQINTILSSDPMCRQSQSTTTQTDGSPRLQAAPGANVALRYQENGHVSLPQGQPGKPTNRGTVYVYGTTQPRADDKFLDIHRVWNAAGNGGDGRGVLLSTQNYDDGQCYQINGGAISQQRQKQFSHSPDPTMGGDLWCQQDIQLPTSAPSGKPYTLYWVWDWPTLPGTEGFPQGKQEIYTTCMDVDITQGAPSQVKADGFIAGQDLNRAAISSEFANIANPTFVTGQTIAFANQPSATAAPPRTSSSAPAPTTSAPPPAGPAPSSARPASSPPPPPPSAAPVSSSTPPAATPPAPPSQVSSMVTVTNVQTVTQAIATATATQQAPVSQAPVSQGGPAFQPGSRPSVRPFGLNGGWPNWQREQDGDFAPRFAQGAVVRVSSTTQTVTVTDVSSVFSTVYQTVTAAANKRAEPTTTATPCSKRAAAYQLRGRSPLYILHESNSASMDC